MLSLDRSEWRLAERGDESRPDENESTEGWATAGAGGALQSHLGTGGCEGPALTLEERRK